MSNIYNEIMKKILLIIISLLLFACTNNEEIIEPEPPTKELTLAYLDQMEAYETLRIGFLGTTMNILNIYLLKN